MTQVERAQAGETVPGQPVPNPVIAGFDRATLMREAETYRRHPDFPRAMLRYTDTALDTFDGHWRESKLVCQTARYVTLFFILYLDDIADPDDPASGATLARLRDLVATGPFASPSWVKLAVRTFERTGMIEYMQPGPDRRLRRFRPTEHLLEMGERALTAMLGALSLVQPLPRPPAVLARRPGVVQSFASTTVQVHLRHGFVVLQPFPEIAGLLGHDFGHLIFTHLIRTMEPDEAGTVFAEAPAGELAERFGVSRSHVRNVLDLGVEMGLLAVEARGGRRVRLEPRFVELCERWVATDLAWMHFLARAALARTPPPSQMS
jgi:hypothetical protein